MGKRDCINYNATSANEILHIATAVRGLLNGYNGIQTLTCITWGTSKGYTYDTK